MDDAGIADLKTVVTEACMNVVVHAYEGEPGPLNVEAEPEPDGLTVIVRDSGVGIRPRPEVEPSSLRLGLSLIAALSSSFSFSGGLDRGTEVVMRLPLEGGGATEGGPPAPVETSSGRHRDRRSAAPSCSARCWLGSSGRSPPAATSRSTASPTRVLLTDAIAAAAPGRFADGKVRLALADGEDGLELRLGPMEDGGADRKSARSSTSPTSAARWRRSPTSSRSRAPRTATTWRSASALPLLLPDLLADPLQGAAQDSRDVHLRVTDLVGDLRLGHVVDEAQAQDQPLALVEVG